MQLGVCSGNRVLGNPGVVGWRVTNVYGGKRVGNFTLNKLPQDGA